MFDSYVSPMPDFFDTPGDGSLRFNVRGTPAPQGSKRAFVVKDRAVVVESSAKVKPWREDVRNAAEDALNGRPPYDGPLFVTIGFTLARPKTAPKSRFAPNVKPDLDKLIRSSLDALKSAGVYTDDSRVCELRAWKQYGIIPGAEFVIVPMLPDAEAVAA